MQELQNKNGIVSEPAVFQRRQETGDRRQETGDRRQETSFRNGLASQESFEGNASNRNEVILELLSHEFYLLRIILDIVIVHGSLLST